MKTGIQVTGHKSDQYRPNGQELMNAFIDSCKHIDTEHIIYSFDNASPDKLNIPEQTNIKHTYVEDQLLRGLTGTWNDAIIQAFDKDGCDIMIIGADDEVFNETINNLIDVVISDNDNDITLYGPLTNGVLGGLQLAKGPSDYLKDVTDYNMVNGFCLAFTKKFYENFKKSDGKLFDEEFQWGGQEEELQRRTWSQGAKSKIVGSCWVFHHKIRGWKNIPGA